MFNNFGRLGYHIYDKNGISDGTAINTSWMGGAYTSEIGITSSGIKFDIILLYNVLHEIGIDEWAKELEFILNLLADDGLLLFSEREILAVGEKPYGKSGYLVLGKEELSKLFPESDIKEVYLPEKQKTATICFMVKKPRTKESYPSVENVKAALLALKDNTKNKIRNRENNGLGERGKSRKYAFYCQQYVNVEEAIEIMDEKEKNEKRFTKNDKKNNNSILWRHDNTSLADIIQANNLSKKDKFALIYELAQTDSEEGEKAKKHLEENKEDFGIFAKEIWHGKIQL